MSQPHKFVYFGTPKVASDTLAYLIEHGFVPGLVVTAPDRPAGRGLQMTPSPVKELAFSYNIPVLTPETLDEEAQNLIRAAGRDYAVVVAYGKIFPETLIASFPQGVLNVHYSLLPRHRGATPLEAALLAGDYETGVTIQKMVKELDAGDMIAQRSVQVSPNETSRELRPRLISLGAELLAETLPRYIDGEVTPVAQDASLATHSHKLKKEDGELTLDGPTDVNWNKYRAFADTIGTYFFTADGRRVKIVTATLERGRFIPLRVIPEGKREMDFADFAQQRS